MENNYVDGPGVDLDLNQEPIGTPFNSTFELVPLFDGIDAAPDTENRSRFLTFLTARARYRQIQRGLRNSAGTRRFPTVAGVDVDDDDDDVLVRETRGEAYERNMDRGKGYKRDNSHLVAKALEMDTQVNINSDGGGRGNFYDCNICLYIAREPILTCCGHLFCWVCFYKLPYADSFMKECPVCNGEVTDSTIVPIYGNGDCPRESKLDSNMVIPQRPSAQRVESLRQQRVARGGFHIPVTEVLRRIRTSIGAINDDREQQQEEEEASVEVVHSGNSPQQGRPLIREALGIGIGIMEQQRLRTRQLSRVITDSGDSLSYISAALNSAERLVEDLETYINLGQFQRRDASNLSPIDEDSIVRDVGTTSRTEEEEEINPPSSSRRNGVAVNFEEMENPRTRSGGELNLPPSSSRRRTSSRLSIREIDASHQSRRRTR